MRLQDLLTGPLVASETRAIDNVMARPTSKIERGQLFIHASSQKKMTVVEPYCGVTESGKTFHLVIESGNGREFRVTEDKLKKPL